MLPPKSVCRPATKVPKTLRDRTTMPRTTPRLRTVRCPGSSKAVVTRSRGRVAKALGREGAIDARVMGPPETPRLHRLLFISQPTALRRLLADRFGPGQARCTSLWKLVSETGDPAL